MGIIELFLIGIGLSMDAFAVSICKGLRMKKMNYKHSLWIALFFGGFQAFMPLVGWVLGSQFEKYITNIDHWIAFVLLSIIGGKMMWEALHPEVEELKKEDMPLDFKELFILAIATSIDALAVGITFAFLKVSILPAIVLIGIITFILSFAGVSIGNVFGSKYKSKAELVGGIILIFIGIKIMVEHLNVF